MSATPAFDALAPLPTERGTLAWARIAVVLISLFCVGIFITSLPSRRDQLLTLGKTTRDVLAALHLSDSFLAWYVVALDAGVLLFCAGVAAILLLRATNDRMALFVAAMLPLYAIYVTRPQDALATIPVWLSTPIDALRALSLLVIVVFTFIFPTGTFVPRWTQALTLVWIGLSVLWVLFPGLPVNVVHVDPRARLALVTYLLQLVWLGAGVAAQIYRYRHVSNRMQQQQTKWVACGVVATVLGYVVFLLPRLLFPAVLESSTAQVVYVVLGVPFLYGVALLLPLSLGLAIQRARLFDIDVLINRTLVYGALTGSATAILATVYIVLSVVLQQALLSVSSQRSQLEVLVSTLVVGLTTLGLVIGFQPVRRRLQTTIDRRFYRAKYDAAQTLASFGAGLRREVDAAELGERLLSVVCETMQPSLISLWLLARDASPDEPRGADGGHAEPVSLPPLWATSPATSGVWPHETEPAPAAVPSRVAPKGQAAPGGPP